MFILCKICRQRKKGKCMLRTDLWQELCRRVGERGQEIEFKLSSFCQPRDFLILTLDTLILLCPPILFLLSISISLSLSFSLSFSLSLSVSPSLSLSLPQFINEPQYAVYIIEGQSMHKIFCIILFS